MRAITENDRDVIEGWFKEAKKMDAAGLPAFVERVVTQYQHDYGTIVMACAAAAVAAAHTVNHSSPQGGISGFQASSVMWEFIVRWMHYESPMALLQYGDMMYPQNVDKFTTIGKSTWEWLQSEAKDRVAARSLGRDIVPVVDAVMDHIRSIADGKVPFGFTVREN